MVDHILKISRPGVFEIRCLSWNTAIIVFMKKLRMDTLFHKKHSTHQYQKVILFVTFLAFFGFPVARNSSLMCSVKKLTISQFAFTFEPVCFNF